MSDGYSIANMQIPAGTTRIKLLKPVVVEGVIGVAVGDVLEVPNGVARTLINMGAAEEVSSEAKSAVTIETREPKVETRDPVMEPETQPRKSVGRKPAK